MSSIDERVVAMKFDNAQFAKGAQSTLDILAQLKNSLRFDGARKGLDEIKKASDGVNFKTMQDGISGVTSGFSSMQAIALGALATIGAKLTDLVVNVGKNMVSSLTSSARDGFGEYELQINSVQTILANTARHGTKIQDVNAALRELNEYADKTIYNFASMTQNIGTFTVAGIKLEDATAAVKGFSNMAALAGANSTDASGAMYQLSQAMSSGVVRLQDWMSIERAGIAGVEFQEALKETARAHGVAVDDIIAKSGSFRNSLSENWLSAEIMTQTLAAATGDLSREQLIQMGYSEQQAARMEDLAKRALASATEVKTFTQLVGTYAEALGSGWAQSWQIIFGDFEEAKALFSEVSGILNGMAEESARARNEQLQIWKDSGGREAFIQGLRNIYEAVTQIITPIREAFTNVFPPSLGKNLTAFSFAFEKFTEKLKIGAEGSAVLKSIFTGLFTVIKAVVTSLGNAVKFVGGIISGILQLGGGLLSLFTPMLGVFAGFSAGAEEGENHVGNFIDRINELRDQALKPLLTFMAQVGQALADLVKGDPSVFVKKFTDAFDELKTNVAGFLDGVGFSLTPLETAAARLKGFFQGAGDALKNLWAMVKPAFAEMGNFFENAGPQISKGMANIDWDQVLATLNTGIFAALILTIRNFIKKGTGLFDGVSGMFEGIGDALGELSGVLKAYQNDLKANVLLKIAGAIGILAASLVLMTMVDPNRLLPATAAMGGLFAALLGSMAVFSKIAGTWATVAKLPILAASMTMMASSLILLSVAVKMFAGLSWEELAKGMAAVAVGLGLLVGAVILLNKFGGNVNKSAAALILLSTAMVIMAAAVKIFSTMDLASLATGLGAVMIMLGGMVGALILLSKFAPNALASAGAIVAVAAALGMLVPAIVTLGLIPFPVLSQGLMALGIALGGFVIALAYLSQNSAGTMIAATAILAMGVALNMIVPVIIALGLLPFPVLIQGLTGLGIAMGMLVIAMNAMNGALAGAAATIVVAGAVVILAAAIGMLGNMPLGNLIQGLVGLAATFLILGAAGLILGPLSPVLLALGGALALIGVGMLAASAAMMVFSLGLAMFGPAATLAAAGLTVLAEAAIKASGAILPLLGLGAGLLVFGAGAAVAAVGVTALGLGLVTMGTGLTLIAATGLAGATILGVVVEKMMALLGQALGMAALGAAMLALGAGLVAVGAGGLLAGAGLLLFGAGLALTSTAGILAAIAVKRITSAITSAAEQSGSITSLAQAITKLEIAFRKLSSNAGSAASSMSAIAASLAAVAQGFMLVSQAATMAITVIRTTVTATLAATAQASSGFAKMAANSVKAVQSFARGIQAEVPKVTASSRALVQAATSNVAGQIRSASGTMSSAGHYVGNAITDGMSRGLYGGSYKVSAAARQVALRALASSKAALGVASPSKEYEEVGMWSDEGLAGGFRKYSHRVESSAYDVGTKAIKGVKESLVGLGAVIDSDMDFNPTITPVVDLSGVQSAASSLNRMFETPKIDVSGSYGRATQVSAQHQETQTAIAERQASSEAIAFNFEQNNYSPKALSQADLYRQTKNLISKTKEALDT